MDESEPLGETTPDDGGAISVIVDAIGTYFGRMPAVLKRNVAKAFGHMMKVPNAYIDGWAAEVRATSDARVLVTKATGKKLAKSIEIDRSLASIAATTNVRKILRQQVNATKVLEQAATEIQRLPVPSAIEIEEIGNDWLNAFEREAIDMSSEHMQKLFGKILAGEIRRPKSYSIRTVKLMAQLDNQPAELFRKLCSLACTMRIEDHVIDSRVVSLGTSAGANGLQKFGLGFGELNILFEYGLIINDYNSYMMYAPVIVTDNKVSLGVSYQRKLYGLSPKNPMTPEQRIDYKVYGVALSQAGKELIDIVDVEPSDEYTKAFLEFVDSQGFVLTPITTP